MKTNTNEPSTTRDDVSLRIHSDVLDSVVRARGGLDADRCSQRARDFADVLRRNPSPALTVQRAHTLMLHRVSMTCDPMICSSGRVTVRVRQPGAVLVATRGGSVVFAYGLPVPGKGFHTTQLIDNAEPILVTAFRAFVEKSDFASAEAIMDAVLAQR